MRTTTTDPMSLNDVTDLESAPYVIEGDLKIYFESEANKCEYLEMEMHGGENSAALTAIFAEAGQSDITGGIN